MSLPCFIFDLDGTLMDFVAVFKEMWRRVWTEFKIDIPKEQENQIAEFARSQMAGQNSKLKLVKLLWGIAKRTGLPHSQRMAYVKASGREYRALIPDIRIFPGVSETLTELRRSGFPIALQSSASQEEITHRMEKYPNFVGKHFDFVLGRDDVVNMKPAPDGILLVAQHFHLSPSHCIYIGDMESDMQAARAAGAVSVGVLTGFDDRSRLKAAGADYVIESVTDLPQVLPQILDLIARRK